jgi:hypothetical protein
METAPRMRPVTGRYRGHYNPSFTVTQHLQRPVTGYKGLYKALCNGLVQRSRFFFLTNAAHAEAHPISLVPGKTSGLSIRLMQLYIIRCQIIPDGYNDYNVACCVHVAYVFCAWTSPPPTSRREIDRR